MMGAEPITDGPPLGHLKVAELIGGVGDLRGRTLAKVTTIAMAPEFDDTPMMARCKAAWRTPFEAMTCEQMRLLIGQGLGLEWLTGIAFELLRRRPLAMITFYAGDLASALLSHFEAVLECDPTSARAFLHDGDFSWIDRQVEIDRKLGGDGGMRAAEALAGARTLAGLGPS